MKPLDSSDAEIEALETLCDRLGGFDERINLEWVDGYMSALLAGPRALEPAEWLPRMLGDAWERAIADPQDRESATRVLMGRWTVIASQLNPEDLLDKPDEPRLAPLMMAFGDAEREELRAKGELSEEEIASLPPTGALWALGFLDAVQEFSEDWVEPPEDSEAALWFHDSLDAIAALAIDDEAELAAHIERRYPGEKLSREELVDDACMAVQDLRLYWVEHAPRNAPRRVDKAPGRNDPCPCGSGKKFKKCHGVAAND